MSELILQSHHYCNVVVGIEQNMYLKLQDRIKICTKRLTQTKINQRFILLNSRQQMLICLHSDQCFFGFFDTIFISAVAIRTFIAVLPLNLVHWQIENDFNKCAHKIGFSTLRLLKLSLFIAFSPCQLCSCLLRLTLSPFSWVGSRPNPKWTESQSTVYPLLTIIC